MDHTCPWGTMPSKAQWKAAWERRRSRITKGFDEGELVVYLHGWPGALDGRYSSRLLYKVCARLVTVGTDLVLPAKILSDLGIEWDRKPHEDTLG